MFSDKTFARHAWSEVGHIEVVTSDPRYRWVPRWSFNAWWGKCFWARVIVVIQIVSKYIGQEVCLMPVKVALGTEHFHVSRYGWCVILRYCSASKLQVIALRSNRTDRGIMIKALKQRPTLERLCSLSPLSTKRHLSLHEHQAQSLLSKHGVRVPRGNVGTSVEQVASHVESLGGNAVLKSQILAGGRGRGSFDSGLRSGVHIVSRLVIEPPCVCRLLKLINKNN